MLEHMADHVDIFICPACGGDLKISKMEIHCAGCGKQYRLESGIPLLFCPATGDASKKDVTDVVRSFYEATPFPNYEELENVGGLVQKARRGIFARLLNEQIPFNIRVLEVGCGTGQLSNYLGVAQRYVFGADMCVNSLKMAEGFRSKNSLHRVGFYQMNLFRPIFKKESFPLVICMGVLHHTGDPFGGFQSIARLVKKGGYIIVGLYNTYSRITTDLRRGIFNVTGDRFKFLDPRLRRKDVGAVRKMTWFMDQYKNPHESKHSMGEVLQWLEKTGFDFVSSIPKSTVFGTMTEDEKLFKPAHKGNPLGRLLIQVRSIFSDCGDGGFFLMIGKKRN
jgi:SAM-dependent methyltransferase